ncbi:DNA-binding transcriptional regulator, IclR family [Amycolatopsis arida]|uniref:DNA-binding transcriptional regulator, IclR family n=1 Tax=Amycolatopsis arida TaxID=587909 RepID=A0A1I5ZQE7_9PSEU|nr:IclR family transcriptional regulator [Amycolatopsis arida]TDX89280.1 DNA-binding IclR family transcriptional regulator [Amycolatopsis arida]SFQ58630.1 DNA-binding transcriptional regulator, IclR family [Amycolatopsis arida]
MCPAHRNDDPRAAPGDDGAGPSVVARVTALLTAFRPGDDALGVSELARRTGLPKSSVHRLAGGLVEHGLLERDGGALRLGLKLFEIGQLATRQRGIVDAARPYLADLREATRNTVHLAVLEGTEVVYLDVLRGPDAPRLPSRIGGRFPAHATAVGKAILAHSPAAMVDAVVAAGLPRISRRTITAPGLLRRQLEKVRAEGIAYEREESGVGVVCAASPLLDPGGRAVAAISISGWTSRMRTDRVAPAVRTAALALSRGLPPL